MPLVGLGVLAFGLFFKLGPLVGSLGALAIGGAGWFLLKDQARARGIRCILGGVVLAAATPFLLPHVDVTPFSLHALRVGCVGVIVFTGYALASAAVLYRREGLAFLCLMLTLGLSYLGWLYLPTARGLSLARARQAMVQLTGKLNHLSRNQVDQVLALEIEMEPITAQFPELVSMMVTARTEWVIRQSPHWVKDIEELDARDVDEFLTLRGIYEPFLSDELRQAEAHWARRAIPAAVSDAKSLLETEPRMAWRCVNTLETCLDQVAVALTQPEKTQAVQLKNLAYQQAFPTHSQTVMELAEQARYKEALDDVDLMKQMSDGKLDTKEYNRLKTEAGVVCLNAARRDALELFKQDRPREAAALAARLTGEILPRIADPELSEKIRRFDDGYAVIGGLARIAESTPGEQRP